LFPSPGDVDRLVADAPAYGWTLLFADRHPQAGGPGTYAGYLANADGFEVELVAGVDGGNLLDAPAEGPLG
jgi:hypothetical protein